jgi:hypothetical protein
MGLLALVASNLAVASKKPIIIPKYFIITYNNHTTQTYTYINNLPLDSPKQGFYQLGNWVGEGRLAIGDRITFKGILDYAYSAGDHWVKFKLINSRGKELVFDLVAIKNGEPVLYLGNNEAEWTNLPKTKDGVYMIEIDLHTESGIDIPHLVNPYTAAAGATDSPFSNPRTAAIGTTNQP